MLRLNLLTLLMRVKPHLARRRLRLGLSAPCQGSCVGLLAREAATRACASDNSAAEDTAGAIGHASVVRCWCCPRL